MMRISKPFIGCTSTWLGVLVALVCVQSISIGREVNPPPKFKIQETPINRETRGVTSYAPVIKRAAPSVVNIYSTRTVRMRRMPMVPFFNDPMFRQFFGEDPENQNPTVPNPRGRGPGGNRPDGETKTRKEQSLGSGVIVSPEGYVLTANHVVEGADPDGVKVSLAAGGREYVAKIIGTDPQTDIAVLKINADNLAAVTIADSDKLEVGDIVLAIGNPFGVGQTVTMGMVSALGRTSLGIIPEGYENFIQTDAPINQGNSGGALIDAEGRLIGINTAIFSPSGGNTGIGFAVPVNLARGIMERLIQDGKVTRGYLGVSLQSEISPDLAKEFGLADESGALVTDVLPSTPAARVGIQAGDVITEINGRKITDRDQLRLMVSQMAPGSKVNVKLLRSDTGRKPVEKNVTTTLGTLRPSDMANRDERMGLSEGSGTPDQDSLDGVEVAELDAGTRRQFGVPDTIQGALVTSVEPDSNSAAAGVRPGDVIREINRHPVRNADDAVEMSKDLKGDRVLLRIWRNGSSLFLPVDNSKKKTNHEE